MPQSWMGRLPSSSSSRPPAMPEGTDGSPQVGLTAGCAGPCPAGGGPGPGRRSARLPQSEDGPWWPGDGGGGRLSSTSSVPVVTPPRPRGGKGPRRTPRYLRARGRAALAGPSCSWDAHSWEPWGRKDTTVTTGRGRPGLQGALQARPAVIHGGSYGTSPSPRRPAKCPLRPHPEHGAHRPGGLTPPQSSPGAASAPTLRGWPLPPCTCLPIPFPLLQPRVKPSLPGTVGHAHDLLSLQSLNPGSRPHLRTRFPLFFADPVPIHAIRGNPSLRMSVKPAKL